MGDKGIYPLPAFEETLLEASDQFDERLDLDVATLLAKPLRRIAVAESVTGGLLSDRLTRVPGSSTYFVGGIVCYSPMVKLQYCGVTAAVLSQFGAVSPQVASQMAAGVQKNLKTDIGLSVTGYAGPDRHNAQNTGTVFIGVRISDQQRVHPFKFQGTRSEIKSQAAQAAMVQLKQWLEMLARQH